MDKWLHIVCIDVPYPPDYGGAVDMFYKIKFLSEAGVNIILHCFSYGRVRQQILEKYCAEVYYYKRKKSIPLKIPYIVSSRRDTLLIKRLLSDPHPVLLEGIHCTYYLYKKLLRDKNVWVRMHNIESEYYANLSKSTHDVFKRCYYRREGQLLKSYEKKIFADANLVVISERDFQKMKADGIPHVQLVPLFIDHISVSAQPGRGSYCLYHGNLSVADNEKAALFIANEIAPFVNSRFIIAGKNPGRNVRIAAARNNVELIENPDDTALDQLLKDAHVNVFPFFNTAGVKVKLVHALFKGRFVVTNTPDNLSQSLAGLCTFAQSKEDFRQAVQELMEIEFPEAEKIKRKEILARYYDPFINTQRLIRLIFN